jgi:predicted Zn-dependent protease
MRRGLAALAAIGLIFAHTAAQAQSLALIRDTEIEETLRVYSDPVFTAAGLTPKNVRIHLIGDKEINAFVAGGQNMFLNTGLIIETKTPNELIGVIAHETGHIAGGHLARSGDASRAATGTFILTMGLGVLAAIAGAPDAAAVLVGNSGYFATLSVLGYSRVQESAADQAAATYLDHSGQSGRGLVRFFDNFRYQEVFSDAKRYPFFRSHPLSSDRIEALRARVEVLPDYDKTDSAELQDRHTIMIAKLKAFMNPPQQTFIEFKETDTSYPARYARAIAYYRSLETEKALKAIDALLKEQPDNPYLWELRGQTLFESARAKEAEPAYRRCIELMPKAALFHLALGQTLLAQDDAKRTDEAIDQINRAMVIEDDNPFGWRMLSEAYDRKGQPGMARLAAAEQFFSIGSPTEARVFAMRAREALTKDSPGWRRATDIVLTSEPTDQDLKDLAKEGSTAPRQRRPGAQPDTSPAPVPMPPSASTATAPQAPPNPSSPILLPIQGKS